MSDFPGSESEDFEGDGPRDDDSEGQGVGIGFVSETLDDDDDGGGGGGGGSGSGSGNNAHIEVFFEEYDSWRPATVIGKDEDGLVIVEYVPLVWGISQLQLVLMLLLLLFGAIMLVCRNTSNVPCCEHSDCKTTRVPYARLLYRLNAVR